MSDLSPQQKTALFELLLAVADDKLMFGHRNSDWTGLGPILEEDIAFSSIAQDEIAHAQALYELASTLDTKKRSADELAFGRTPEQYRCAQIVELPDEFDYATAIARKLFCDHFDRLRLGLLANSGYLPLAQLAKRLVAEEQVHVEHVDGWTCRLGKGSKEANQRLQKALDALSPAAVMLFETTAGQELLAQNGIYAAGDDMFRLWRDEITDLCRSANLTVNLSAPNSEAGGRHGAHSKYLKELLDEMCEVYRIEPTGKW